MRALQSEPLAVKPSDFDPWFAELALFADCQGESATIGVVMNYAPIECVRALAADPARWVALLTRARYADHCRLLAGLAEGLRTFTTNKEGR